MRTPDDFMAMFERKTYGQNKTMQELANDFSNLLNGGPFDRHWLAYAFIAGYRAGERSKEKELKEEQKKAEVKIQELRDQLMEESGGRLKLFKDDADAKAAYQEALEEAGDE
jgi:hypothetical protein